MNVQEAFKEFELKPDASDEEIKKQYKTLSKKYHPDRNKDSSAEDKFKKINAAHEVLKNRNNVQQNNFQYSYSVQLKNIRVRYYLKIP